MAAKDFACFLERMPGAGIWIRNGRADSGRALNTPHDDFNDAVLPPGASYWVRLAESVPAKESTPRVA
jgi:metal-dependent amidase/aminoacylase/carboxypeptidase family protein